MLRVNGLIIPALTVALVAVPTSLFAQQSDGPQAQALEEIVVTSRRDAELLRDVPASVSVLTAESLELTGAANAEDITALTPGVTIVTGTAEVGDTQVNIRGINGARDAESNVALVVDGILKTNTAQLNQIQGALEQVEVLKGPQGAYYGRNATAGAIVMTTRKPGDVYAFDGSVNFGEHQSYGGQATLSGPFSDRAGFVLFGDFRETDGFYKNTGPNPISQGSQVDNYRGWNIGTRLVFTPSDATEIDFKARFGKIDAAALSFNAGFNLPGFAAALGNPDFNRDVNEHPFNFVGNIVPDNRQETMEASIRWTQELSFGTLTAWYLHSDVEQDWLADSTAASFYRFELQPSCAATRTGLVAAGYQPPSPQFFTTAPFTSVFGPFGATTCDGTQYQLRNQQDDSVEIRLASASGGPLKWSIGAYLLQIDRRNAVAIAEDTGQQGIRQAYNPPGSSNPTSLLFDDQFKTDVYAGFGSIQYEATDQLSMSLALRYDREERDVESRVPNVLDPATNTPINPGLPASGTIAPKSRVYTQLQPKVAVTYKPVPEWSLFANWGIGFKAGGFNNQGSNAIIESNFNVPLGANLLVKDDYRKETSSAIEVGTKGSVLGGRLALDLAFYRTEVDDMQFFEFYTGGFGLLRTVTNIDKVEIQGVELGAQYRIADGWTVFGAVNLTDSEIKENASRPNTVGNESPYTAEYTINLGTQAKFPLTDALGLTVRADYRITGPTWFHTVQGQDIRTVFDLVFPGLGTANYTLTQRDRFDTLDLRVGLEGERWSVTAFAQNALDEEWIAEVIPAPEFGGPFIAPGSRRTVGIEVGVKF
ncbi:MAG: TonB-dependent receptor [Proteobacteria bacterium]|nr:TonB-dependent receptor [Pseudomonadota bacterium]